MFFADRSRDLAVAQLPRSANQSIRDWLGNPNIVSNDEAMTYSRRVAFIRHPVERFESGFALMFWMNDYGTPHISRPPVSDYMVYVDHILSNLPDDEHWLPQFEQIKNSEDVYVPTEFRRLDNLSEEFSLVRPGILPHHNNTSIPSGMINNYRRSELVTKYSEDMRLYQAATVG